MFKKAAVMALMLALALTIQPASAAKKKKPKKPKPYKSEQVSVGVAHRILYGNTGSVNLVVAKELENTCETPKSNGSDAYAFQVPAAFQKLTPSIDAIGVSNTGLYDLDLYFFDKDCKNIGASNAVSTDESGVMFKGTAWVVVHNYEGEPGVKAHIEIKA